MKSPKEISTDKKILSLLEGFDLPLKVANLLLQDSEVEAIQDYANNVSIIRLGYNDHGPVHMRTVTCNAVIMMKLLKQAGIKTSLESEDVGSFEDSLTAVVLASFLHDLGMTLGRQDHELYSMTIAIPIIQRILENALNMKNEPTNKKLLEKLVIIRSLALEGIAGHMGIRKIHSLEAGLILIADGCDMAKGRARIPMALHSDPKVGDIHKYSANSIEKVYIKQGIEKPIRIEVIMSSEVGFFQIEEVLLQKINCSPAKSYVELLAGIEGSEEKQYL